MDNKLGCYSDSSKCLESTFHFGPQRTFTYESMIIVTLTAVGHVPGRGRRPGVRTHVTRPTGSLHCLYALIFEAWAGRGSLCCAWGPMGLGACGGNSNLRLLLYTSAKTHFFASAGHGPFQPVASFPSDSRGCPSAPVTDPFETQTLGCCVRGSRHLVTDPIRAVARRHSERPRAPRPIRAS